MNFLRGSVRQYELFLDCVKYDDIGTFKVFYKERTGAKWSKKLVNVGLIVRLCVLYRKPEFLKFIHKLDKACLDSQVMTGLTLLDIARAIGADDCVEIIENSCNNKTKNRGGSSEKAHHSYNLYTSCVKMSCGEVRFPEINVRMIETLSQRGYDINDAGPGGKTPLHEAVMYRTDTTIIEALIVNGTDVDKRDNQGLSPFQRLFQKSRYFERDNFVTIVKSFMTGNPSVDLSRGVIEDALENDENYCRRAPTGREAMELYRTGEQNSDAYRIWVEKKLVTPILINHGFGVGISTIESIDDYHPDLVLVLQHVLSKPPLLSHICRNVLRRTFPGRGIVTYCNTVSIPKSIRAFVLLEISS